MLNNRLMWCQSARGTWAAGRKRPGGRRFLTGNRGFLSTSARCGMAGAAWCIRP